MKVVVWIVEGTWETCLEAVSFLDRDASITLLHVADDDVEHVAHGAHLGLLGRRPVHEPALQAISDEEAQGLLALAGEHLGRFGRVATLEARRGRSEHEVVEAARAADLLVLARDGGAGGGPKSLGRAGRFVVDHAPCPLLLVPGISEPPPPPPRGGGRQPSPPLPSEGR